MGNRLKAADPRYEVSFAENGEMAVLKLKASNYMHDVIIIDFNLSSNINSLNGVELVEVIRGVLGMTRCVIVGNSSNSMFCESNFKLCGAGIVFLNNTYFHISTYSCFYSF